MTSFTNILIIIGGLTICFLPFISYEAYVRGLRKQGRFRHPFVRLEDYMDYDENYDCICGTGGSIILGKRVAKWIMTILIIVLLAALLAFIFTEPLTLGEQNIIGITLMSLIILAVYGNLFRQVYQDMRKHRHDAKCSKKAAFAAIPYQIRNLEGFRIYTD